MEIDNSLGKSVANLTAAVGDGNPIAELGLSILVLVVIIVFHGWCLNRVSQFFSSHFALYTAETARWRVSLLSSTTIALLAIIHLVETLLWTIPLLQIGIIDNFGNAYYFVLEAYTTLGEGNVSLPVNWRLVGPVIAISGLFTFGWTASVLVYVMNQIGQLHSQRTLAAAGGGQKRTKRTAANG